jgi:predicted protein tyrosine phosphatase
MLWLAARERMIEGWRSGNLLQSHSGRLFDAWHAAYLQSEFVPMTRVLFICSQNRMRSPTAEQVFARHPGIECASAGLRQDADNRLTAELVEWAELIFVMERHHEIELSVRFEQQLAGKCIICLDIPDQYGYMDPALIAVLKTKVEPLLPA